MGREDLLQATGAAPDFLSLVGPKEHSLRRLALILLLGMPLALLGVVVALALSVAGAAVLTGRTFGQVLAAVQDVGGAPRHLLSYGFEFTLVGLVSIAAALCLLVIASRVQKRPALSFLTAAPHARVGLFLRGAAAGAALVGLALVVERLWSPDQPQIPILSPGADWGERAAYALFATGFLFLAALAEEIIFRGWLIQQVSAWTRNLVVILIVNGLIFSFVHFDPDASAFVVRCLMGAGWTWIAIRTGGIEFTTGAHFANNLLVSLFVMPPAFTAKPSAGLDLAAVAVEGAVIMLLVAVVEVMLRPRRRPAPLMA